MKKVLLGTSALVAAAMIASPAAAQLDLSVSAFYSVEVGISDDEASSGDDWDFQNEGWIQVNARGTADNGLTYGFRLDLDDVETDASVAVDETYIFFQGGFGTVTLGDDDHAADDVRVGVPTAGTGIFDGGFGDYTSGGGIVSIGPTGNNDSTKIKYTSTGADLSGFTVGISYSPDSRSEGDDVFRVLSDTSARPSPPGTGFDDVISGGVRYSGDFEGFSVTAGAAGYIGENAGTGEDLESWVVGINGGTGGFEAGVNYVDNGDGNSDGFNIGVTYGQGPWEVGATYSDFDNDGPGDEQIYGIGGSYDWLPGVGIDADIVGFDSPGSRGDGWVALLRVGISA